MITATNSHPNSFTQRILPNGYLKMLVQSDLIILTPDTLTPSLLTKVHIKPIYTVTVYFVTDKTSDSRVSLTETSGTNMVRTTRSDCTQE